MGKKDEPKFKQEFMLDAEDKHPLLNPDSTHYQMVDGVESIERLEQMYSLEEMMIWAKITAMKYRMRIGNKDNAEKEAVKIRGYEKYYKWLYKKVNK